MCDKVVVVGGDQGHELVNWNDSRFDQENGHFSSPEQILQNPPPSCDASFDFRSPDKSCSKKIKLSPFNQQEEEEIDSSEESSPLGLKLDKSPSLISFLERSLSQGRQTSNTSPQGRQTSNTSTMSDSNCDNKKPTSKHDFGSQPMSEKLKASNFPAMLLKIGTWQRNSMHEGDLVAKCYYAKRKLVWEVLEGALKSKIEIQWSDIVGIRATITDDQPGILEIELHQPPSFFREINPQPRKHTLWQQASDFTGGQAPICRRHYVKFAPGILDKHYEKLLQCDPRIQLLSQRSFPSQESLYFDANAYGFPELSIDFNNAYGAQFLAGIQYPYQISPGVPIHLQNVRQRPPFRIMDSNSPMSVNDFMLENQGRAFWSQTNFAKGNHIPVAAPTVNPLIDATMDFSSHTVNGMPYEEMRRKSSADMGLLSDIENHLLSESQIICPSDENTIAANMRSMYPLLDPEELVNPVQEELIQGDPTVSGGLFCYPGATNWIPHDFDEGILATNNFSTLAANLNM